MWIGLNLVGSEQVSRCDLRGLRGLLWQVEGWGRVGHRVGI